ncbi:MAG: S1C family serine protease [Acidimicrobiales bacterium]
MAERVLPGLVTVTATTSSGTRHGTGLVFRSDGMILTAVPLVAGAASVTVTARDGRHWEGAVVGQDARTGVAVVQIPGSGVGFGPLGPPPSLHVGQLVLAVTAGPTPEAPLSISLGVVDAVHQQVHLSGGQSIPDAIESDAHPSNASGGVLLDQQGRIIGLLEANLSLPDGQGCVATPVALASWAAGQLASSGHVAHAWLGVDGGNVPAGHSDALDRRGGALVDRVQPASPAAAAGLVPGDVVDSVNGHPVTSMNDLQRALLPLTPGTAVELGVDRHGHQLTLRVVLGPA